MSDVSEQTAFTPQAPESIRWRSWPARDNAVWTSLVVVGLLAVGVLVCWLTQQVYLALLAPVALAAALWRFFLPVEFELGVEGVEQRVFGRRRCIRWQQIRRYEVCSAGVLLLPGDDRSALAPLRGLYLPFSTHRQQVLAHVHHYLGRP